MKKKVVFLIACASLARSRGPQSLAGGTVDTGNSKTKA
jgi:hypothetical protein